MRRGAVTILLWLVLAGPPGTAAAVGSAGSLGAGAGPTAPGPPPGAVTEKDRTEPLPKELEGVGITEHLDARLPLDLDFADEEGRTVRLGEYFERKRPVILNLAYYTCPMLCTLVLNGVVEGIKGLAWRMGKDFEIVTVSIDPAETPALARIKKENYLETYGRPGAGAGWHFLTGRQESITALARAVGFGYRYDPKTRQFMHTAVTMLCTPDGRLSRYLYGIQYERQTLRLGLLEASQGKIGTTLDQLVLYCFHYDAAAGRYAPVALAIMRVVGGAAAGILAVVLLGFWLGESLKSKGRAGEAGTGS